MAPHVIEVVSTISNLMASSVDPVAGQLPDVVCSPVLAVQDVASLMTVERH